MSWYRRLIWAVNNRLRVSFNIAAAYLARVRAPWPDAHQSLGVAKPIDCRLKEKAALVWSFVGREAGFNQFISKNLADGFTVFFAEGRLTQGIQERTAVGSACP